VEKNIIRENVLSGMFVHGGSNNTIRNNVLFNTSNVSMPTQHGSCKATSEGLLLGEMMAGPPNHRTPTNPPIGNIFERNIIVAGSAQQRVTLVGASVKSMNYSSAATLSSNVYWSTRLGSKLAVQAHSTPLGSWKVWQDAGHDQGSVIADPLFVDLDGGYFGLSDASPALAMGFLPLENAQC
jgi:parallel beta-helix repeat protein